MPFFFKLFLFYLLPVIVSAYMLQILRQWRTRQAPPFNASTFLERIDISSQTRKIHLVVLVHGWMGNSLEMDYLKDSLQRQARYNENQSETFLIHAAVCNEGQTSDGIAAGGSRLAKETNEIVKHLWQKYTDAEVTLSLVGNSLGGLYSRFALSEIAWDAKEQRQKLIPRLFVTTATPHLGVSQHTYIRLPRSVEYPIAKVMQQTGKDLFRFSSVIDDMTFQPNFLAPLQQFEQRIAYINVYGTDFQVPTPTAAFWAETDSLHELVSEESEPAPSNVIMRLKTASSPQEELLFHPKSTENSQSTISYMTQRLDGLGWIKVLIDVRDHMPSLYTGRRSVPVNARSAKETWTARELLSTFGGMQQGRLTLAPLGHTVMIANSKDAFNRWVTKGGKPIMDHLATTMVQTLSDTNNE